MASPPDPEADARGALDPASLGLYGRTLTLDPPTEGRRAVPADDLVAGGGLHDALTGHGDDPGGVPAPVTASCWVNHAVAALVPGVLAAWTLQGVGLDASSSNVVLHVEDGLPREARLRDPTADPRGRHRAVETLLGDHLSPLFEGIEEAAGLSPAIPWGTAGTLVAWMYDRMADDAPDEAPVARDRARLLEADRAAWADAPNPLQDPVEWTSPDAEDLPDRVLVRRTCCMKREVPTKDACHSCPNVGPETRAALLREGGHGAD